MTRRDWIDALPELVVVVGSGGVGKTTVASALALESARRGGDTLVMTFDPSRRLKDALGIDAVAGDHLVQVEREAGRGEGVLWASLLDARATFDRLVERYAPDAAARRRILENRFYRNLAGGLSGILEYMAVERLFEVAAAGTFARIVLDTPPTAQALDFLQAPERIVRFVDSGVHRLASREWFDERGRLLAGGPLRGRLERLIDDVVGLGLVRDMLEFFRAFAPLFEGFRERAAEVRALLRSERSAFVLVCGPAEERVADALYFARRLREGQHQLGPLLVNRVHPRFEGGARGASGLELLRFLGERDAAGVAHLRSLLQPGHPLGVLALQEDEPASLEALSHLARQLSSAVAE